LLPRDKLAEYGKRQEYFLKFRFFGLIHLLASVMALNLCTYVFPIKWVSYIIAWCDEALTLLATIETPA
jgi:hypothetical protein